jgi:protein-tyrosine phosphatase
MKILMVCLGNICRSPLAEGILRSKTKKAGLNWEIDSAGTSAHNVGCQPHKLSQKVARLYNIDICNHKCRHFTKSDMDTFDKIYVMDAENYRDAIRIAGNKWNDSKVDLLLNELYPGQNRDIFDPWYGGEEGFYQVYNMISEACDAIIEEKKEL